jgi:hypothetical protein
VFIYSLDETDAGKHETAEQLIYAARSRSTRESV